MTHPAPRAIVAAGLAAAVLAACSSHPAAATDPLGPDDVVVVVDHHTDSASTVPWSEDVAVEEGTTKIVCRGDGIWWLLMDVEHTGDAREGRQDAPGGGVWGVEGPRAGDLAVTSSSTYPQACDVEAYNDGQYSQGRAVELPPEELPAGEAGTVVCDPGVPDVRSYVHAPDHQVSAYRDPLDDAQADDTLVYEGAGGGEGSRYYTYEGTICDDLGLAPEVG